jgi:hypothetical protein
VYKNYPEQASDEYKVSTSRICAPMWRGKSIGDFNHCLIGVICFHPISML